jgi:hypothetical protein
LPPPRRDATVTATARCYWSPTIRVSELTDLRWDQIDFTTANLHVRRAKKGTPATHPILGDELRALRRLQREQDPKSPFVFTSERGGPLPALSQPLRSAPAWRSRRTRTCCAMPVASHWPTRGMIREPTWAIRISSTPSVIRSCHRRGSRIFGGISAVSAGGKVDHLPESQGTSAARSKI